MKNTKTAALLITAVLSASVFTAGCGSAKGESSKSESSVSGSSENEGGRSEDSDSEGSGDALSAFTAATLDGGTFTQEDIAAKDVTIMNFWGTFCGPCIAEMPDLADFEKALPDNVQLVTVCIDAQGSTQEAEALLEQAGYEGVTLIGGDGDFETLLSQIQAVPITMFFDAEGRKAGDEILGGQQDLSGMYLAAVNAVLKESGKAEISLEK